MKRLIIVTLRVGVGIGIGVAIAIAIVFVLFDIDPDCDSDGSLIAAIFGTDFSLHQRTTFSVGEAYALMQNGKSNGRTSAEFFIIRRIGSFTKQLPKPGMAS